MKQPSFLLMMFIFKNGFCLHSWPMKLLYVAQLETARTIRVILKGGLAKVEGRRKSCFLRVVCHGLLIQSILPLEGLLSCEINGVPSDQDQSSIHVPVFYGLQARAISNLTRSITI